jgi:cyclopropane-fatty-acyl-phospholipid synthase
MSWLADRLMAVGVAMAEHGAVPDTIIRAAMRKVIQSRLETVSGGASSTLQEATGPIAEDVDTANQQHYEVPPEFFTTVLGPRLKYSCAYWGPEVDDLAAAEEAMLELYCERASLSDGQIVLDLGCGWGSFSLWAAERFPNSEVFAVSNSRMQGEYIEKQAADSGLDNIHVETATFAITACCSPGLRVGWRPTV